MAKKMIMTKVSPSQYALMEAEARKHDMSLYAFAYRLLSLGFEAYEILEANKGVREEKG